MSSWSYTTIPLTMALALMIQAWIIKARAIVKGMVVYDHEDMRVDFLSDVSKWIKEERIHYLEDITEGLANAPAAFSRLMRGLNTGKTIIKIND